MNFNDGQTLLFDKPLYWTSFDLVNKVRNTIRHYQKGKKEKVGHAGTLDPLATGLMIICTGKKTKEIDLFLNKEKEYIATIRLGATTPSFDLETEIDKTYDYNHITENLIRSALENFKGEQLQIPPIFSAKRINGKRAYEHARAGEDVKINPHLINLFELELLNFQLPDIKIRILCSKGTYIRAFARDLGLELKSGAHLVELQRTKIGNYNIKDAITVTDFENLLKNIQ